MHADESAAMITLRQSLAAIKSQPQRGDVRADGVVRFDRLGDEVRPLAFLARIFVLAEVRERPAVERPFAHARQIIRYQVIP